MAWHSPVEFSDTKQNYWFCLLRQVFQVPKPSHYHHHAWLVVWGSRGMQCLVGEVNKWSLHVWFLRSMEEEMWGCFAGATVSDLFWIQGRFDQHAYHSILQQYAIPSGLRLVGLAFVFFNRTMTQNTPPGCVRGISPRRVMECCIRWLGLQNHPTSTQLRWFGMSWTEEWRKSSQQVFRLLEKHSSWSWLRSKRLLNSFYPQAIRLLNS